MGRASILAEARARQALRASRLPFKGQLEPASSTRNEIFLTDRYVIRVNRSASNRLRREAQLYRSLPTEPWAPHLVAVGEGEHDYLIVARKPGRPLAHCWPDLTVDERHRAVTQLAGHLRALHATPTPADLPPLPANPHLFDDATTAPGTGAPVSAGAIPPALAFAPDGIDRLTATAGTAAGPCPAVAPVLDGIERLGTDPNADPLVLALARDQVLAWAEAVEPFERHHLIHGDLTFENLLWDGTDLSAVVDFEWCRGAPADLDLDVLLRCCAYPQAHVAPEHAERARAADYQPVVLWLVDAYPELFAHPRLADRLRLYALAFEVRAALETPVPANRSLVPALHPWNRLVAQVSSGGHLAHLLEEV